MPEFPPASFEDTLAELESIVDTLEQSELPLDDSLRRLDSGLARARAFNNKNKTTISVDDDAPEDGSLSLNQDDSMNLPSADADG